MFVVVAFVVVVIFFPAFVYIIVSLWSQLLRYDCIIDVVGFVPTVFVDDDDDDDDGDD